MTIPMTPRTVRTCPDEWIPQPDGQGTLVQHPRTIGEVWEDIVAALPAYGVDLRDFDYAGPASRTHRDKLFPQEYRWLACFGVRGCSEGWYVHVETVRSAWLAGSTPSLDTEEGKVIETIYLAKTFAGWDTANALVAALTKILDQ